MPSLKSLFELIVDCGQQKIHHQIEAYDEVAHKEDHIPVLSVVGWQHHIRIVSSCEQDKHAPHRLLDVLEVSKSFVGRREDKMAKACVGHYQETDRKDDDAGIVQVVNELCE